MKGQFGFGLKIKRPIAAAGSDPLQFGYRHYWTEAKIDQCQVREGGYAGGCSSRGIPD